jgi:hypothetical protein
MSMSDFYCCTEKLIFPDKTINCNYPPSSQQLVQLCFPTTVWQIIVLLDISCNKYINILKYRTRLQTSLEMFAAAAPPSPRSTARP